MRLNRYAAVGALVLAAGAFTLLAMQGGVTRACEHPPREFKYPIKAGAQRGLIMFAGGRQHMVIAPSYSIEDVPAEKIKNDAIEGFTSLAWVIPVPALPDTYEEASAKLFASLEEFTRPHEAVGKNSQRDDNDEKSEEEGAQFFEPVKAGAYAIQPIKASGDKGSLELNTWLDENGFGKIKEDLLKYYNENNFYWLAIKLSAEKGLPVEGALKPLHIGMFCTRPTYPLKIRAGMGAFDLELYVITRDEVDLDKSKGFGLHTIEQADSAFLQSNRKTTFDVLPSEVRDLVKNVAEDKPRIGQLRQGVIYCYRFMGSELDAGKLTAELTFEFKASGDKRK